MGRMPLLRAEAGSRPAGEVLFFASPKKSTQKKGDPAVCVPCADATGQPAVLGFGGVSLELAPFHFAQTIASPHPPNPALLGASRGARGAEQPHGPLLRSAQLAQRVALAPARRGRAQQWPEWLCGCWMFGCPPLLAAPAAGRLWGGTRVGARVLRALTRRGCPSGARSAKRVPRRTPQPPRRRFAPSHSEGVADWGSPFLW